MDPTPKEVHIDSALTMVSIGYKNPMFIGDQVFPNVPVAKQSDYFYKFNKGAWFRRDAGVRAPGAPARRSGYTMANDTYACQEIALGHPVPIEVINNADAPLTPFSTGVRYSTNQILLEKEIAVASAILTSGNWTTNNDAAAGWLATSDGSGNTFIADIEAYKETVRQLIGVYPNTLIMDAITFKNCKNEYSVLDRIKYASSPGNPALVTVQTIASLFELERVLIGGGIYSDAEETVAGDDFNAVDIWEVNAGKGSAWLGWVSPTPALDMPSAGYVFSWKGGVSAESALLASDEYREVKYWWDNDTESYIVKAAESYDVKVTCADGGVLFTDTIVT